MSKFVPLITKKIHELNLTSFNSKVFTLFQATKDTSFQEQHFQMRKSYIIKYHSKYFGNQYTLNT